MKQAVELNYKEKDGIMYPDIQNSNSREADETPLGKYGQMALSYLKEYHPHRYTYLLMEGELLPTMHRVNEEAHNYLNTIMEQMLKNDPIPDPSDTYRSYQHRMQLMATAEEITLAEIVYKPR